MMIVSDAVVKMKRTFPNTKIEEFFTKRTKVTPATLSSSQQSKTLTFIKSTPQKKVKKISIEGLSDEGAPPEEFFESIWKFLQTGIDEIFTSDPLAVNFNKLYHDVEYFCRFKNPVHLYNLVGPHLQGVVQAFVEDLSTSEIIEDISSKIIHFESSISDFRKVFMYFDRSFLFATRYNGFSSLSELIHSQLHDCLVERSAVLQNMAVQLCMQVSLYRADEDVDWTPLKELLHFFIEIGLYGQEVLARLHDLTKSFYSQIPTELKMEEFLEFLTKSLEKEQGLVSFGLPQETHELILQIIRDECLLGHQEIIFGPEFDTLFDENEKSNGFSTLSKVRHFFNTEDTFPTFSEKFADHYTREISSIFEKPKGEWIDALLDSYTNGLKLVKKAFAGESSILRTLKSTYEQSFQKKGDILPKLLARRMSRCTGIERAEINLFRLMPMKELFEESYKYYLGKRITSQTDFDLVREKLLIEKLSTVTGKEFTIHLCEMLTDVSDSSIIPSPPVVGLQFSALVVSAHNYHGVSTFENPVIYPRFINQAQNQYGQAYQAKYKRRTLVWSPALSTATLSFGNISLKMSGIQALILINIQKEPSHALTIAQLVDLTKIDATTLESNLSVLASSHCGKILKKTTIGREKDDQTDDQKNDHDLNDQNSYAINYAHSLKGGEAFPEPVAKIPGIEEKKGDGDAEYIMTNMLKCSVVEVLKRFRMLSVNELFSKVSKSLGFPVEQGKFITVLGNLKNLEFVGTRDQKTYFYIE